MAKEKTSIKYDPEDFKKWLRESTILLNRSIWLYERTVRRFLKEYYNNVNVNNLKTFIKESSRDRNTNYVKYALKHYLKYIGLSELYAELPGIRQHPKKSISEYPPAHIRKNIIMAIKKKKYQDMAMIHDAIGARAIEITTIREEKIDLQTFKDIIKIEIVGKGAKDRMAYLDKEIFKPLLTEYFIGRPGYLFIPKDIEDKDMETQDKIIDNHTLYYERAIKEGALSLGMDNFTSHDFRRCMVDDILEKTGDITIAQAAAGHASIITTEKYLKQRSERYKDIIIQRQKGS